MAVFPVGNIPLYAVKHFRIECLFLHQLFQYLSTVGGIHNCEVGFVTESFVFAAQNVQTEVVKGRNVQPFGVFVLQQLGDTFLHLFGGLVGESHGVDVMRF